MNKLECRQMLRAQRKKLSADFISASASQVASRCIQLSVFLNSQHVAFYSANEGEMDPIRIVKTAHEWGKHLYLPIFSAKSEVCLSFYPFQWNSALIKNELGIEEPVVHNASPIPVDQLELIFIPMVGFDAQCHRLGRGAGCYDRCLEFVLQKPIKNRPTLIGLAYEFQKLDHLISESWDVPMDYVVTEKAIYRR